MSDDLWKNLTPAEEDAIGAIIENNYNRLKGSHLNPPAGALDSFQELFVNPLAQIIKDAADRTGISALRLQAALISAPYTALSLFLDYREEREKGNSPDAAFVKATAKAEAVALGAWVGRFLGNQIGNYIPSLRGRLAAKILGAALGVAGAGLLLEKFDDPISGLFASLGSPRAQIDQMLAEAILSWPTEDRQYVSKYIVERFFELTSDPAFKDTYAALRQIRRELRAWQIQTQGTEQEKQYLRQNDPTYAQDVERVDNFLFQHRLGDFPLPDPLVQYAEADPQVLSTISAISAINGPGSYVVGSSVIEVGGDGEFEVFSDGGTPSVAFDGAVVVLRFKAPDALLSPVQLRELARSLGHQGGLVVEVSSSQSEDTRRYAFTTINTIPFVVDDLSPKFHPVESRIRSSFGPERSVVATAWGAKPPVERSAPGCCGTEALRAA